MNIFICGLYLRAATIFANSQSLRQLFKGGYYSKCGIYSRKYDVYIYNYIFICIYSVLSFLNFSLFIRFRLYHLYLFILVFAHSLQLADKDP